MLNTYLSTLGGFFDRRFIIAYWVPMFLFLAILLLGGAALLYGPGAALAAWAALDPMMQVLVMLAALLGITVLAYLLQALTTPLLRFYEGYWPDWLGWLREKAQADQKRRMDAMKGSEDKTHDRASLQALHQPGVYRQRYFHYPRSHEMIRATSLGNTLTASEEYPYIVYRIDSILWWPRLTPLLPEDFRKQVDQNFTPLLALINLSFLFTLLAFLGGGLLLFIDIFVISQSPWFFALVFVGGLLLAKLSYEGAVAQAVNYGTTIRVAFDLYRHSILKQMHIPVPDSLLHERVLWDALNQWVYHFIPPWDSGWPLPKEVYPSGDFYYDFHKEPSPPAKEKLQKIELDLSGSPTLILRQEGGKDE